MEMLATGARSIITSRCQHDAIANSTGPVIQILADVYRAIRVLSLATAR
jgi:hypothetical protein